MESEEQKRIQSLIRLFEHPRRDKVNRARKRLVDMGASVLDALIEATSSPVTEVRVQAVIALGEIKDKRAYDVLFKSLNDPDSFVRYEAAWSLCVLGDARAIVPLADLALKGLSCEGSKDGAADGASMFFDRFGEQAVDHLSKIIDTGDEDEVRWAIMQLGAIRGDKAYQTLAGLSDSPSTDTRIDVLDSLERMVEWHEDELGRKCLRTIEQYLDDPDTSVRKHARELSESVKVCWRNAAKTQKIGKAWSAKLILSEKHKDEKRDRRNDRSRYYRRRRRRMGIKRKEY